MLHGGGLQSCTDIHEERSAPPAFGTIDAHLDQFVGLEATVDFGEDGVGEAVLADAGDRLEAVGAGAQGAPL